MKRNRALRHLSVRAGRVLTAVPAKPTPWVLGLGRRVSGFYVRRIMGIRRIDLRAASIAAEAVADAGNRVIFAFRHPSRDDPVVMFHTIANLLPKAAHQTGSAPHGRIYPVFLYGRGVAVWGGPLVAWLLPRGGAISVYHQQVNRGSMEAVFREVIHGVQPMALAPEAQVTYHNDRVARIQRGTAVLAHRAQGAQGAQGARRSGKNVVVIPVGLRYRYHDDSQRTVLRRILAVPAGQLGIQPIPPTRDGVLFGWDSLLDLLVADYTGHFPRLAGNVIGSEKLISPQAKLDVVRRIAFAVAERMVDAPERDDPVERIFEIRRRVYARMFSLKNGGASTSRLAALRHDVWAMNGAAASVHLELVDLLAYLDFDYINDASDPDRVAEYALCLADACGRAIGHSIGKRPQWPGRSCCVTFGDPIPVLEGKTRFRDRVQKINADIEVALTEISAAT